MSTVVLALIIGACAGLPVALWCCTGPGTGRKPVSRHLRRIAGYVVRYFAARSIFDLIWRR
jgi:hypothetical protein